MNRLIKLLPPSNRMGSNTSIDLQKGKMQLQQQTNYPWDGAVQITVAPERKMKFPLQIRIPGWAQNIQAQLQRQIFSSFGYEQIRALYSFFE